ncbi:MAG: hypothetical protein ACRENF_07105 [Thermodesulfobacteriota bacterium]
MDAKNQLMYEKTKLLTQIAEAAQRGESQEVLAAGEKLAKVESIISRYEKLLRDISDLDTDGQKSQPLGDTREDSELVKDKDSSRLHASGRGIGRTIRMDFLQKVSENGIHLRHIRGSIYETQSGHKVGIAVAQERKPDRWFLGLPLEGFDQAVLLCKRDTGDTVEICLPKNFFNEHGDNMSQSGGQMKFNIARRESGYAILVPGTDGVSASKFLGDYSLLK